MRPPKTQSPDFPKLPREFVEMHDLNDHAQDVVEGRWFRWHGKINARREKLHLSPGDNYHGF